MTSRISFRLAVLMVCAMTAGIASAQFGSSQGEVRFKTPKIPGNTSQSIITIAEDVAVEEKTTPLVRVAPQPLPKPVAQQTTQPIRLVRYSPQDDMFLDPGFAVPELDDPPMFEPDPAPLTGSPEPFGPIFPDTNGGGFEVVDPDPLPIRTPTTSPTTAPNRNTVIPNGPSRLPLTNPTPGSSSNTSSRTGTNAGSTASTNSAYNDCDMVSHRKIKELRYDITPKPNAELPISCPITEEGLGTFDRNFECRTVHWKASALYAKGGVTYFEDRNLERYGHSVSPALQPLISGGKFFLTIPVLPYKMGVTMPSECVYDLGYYRPGSCAPHQMDPIPISARAALMEAGAIVGGVFLFP